MSTPGRTNPPLSLITLPLEIFRIILDKVYEDSYALTISKPLRAAVTTTSDLPTTPLLVNCHIYNESLDAIHRSKDNTISVKLHANFPDIATIPESPSLTSFYSSATTLNLVDFPYDSSDLKAWKQICPKLQQVNVQHAYSTAANAPLHRLLLKPDFSALLRGDIDTDFTTTAMERILHVHPEFQLNDLEGIHLTFPNFVDFWAPAWKREYYHANRVLVFNLTITQTKSFVSQKYFKNRLRSIRYEPCENGAELPKFPGVDYDVRFMREGSQPNLDYDYRKDCFRSPYSPAGV